MTILKAPLLISCLILFSLGLYAQNTQIFEKSNSTLPDNDLLNIVTDHNGNEWIGTAKSGIVKFDGQNFTIYDKTNSPVTNHYSSPLCVDKKGNVWVSFSGSSSGVAKFDGVKWTIVPELTKSIICVKEDRDGKMFFGTQDGVITYDGSKWSKLALPNESLYRYNVLAMDISKTGQMAVGCDAGLLLYDGKQWHSLNEQNSELQVGTVRALKYASGELYIGYGGGFGKGGFSVLKDGKWKHYDKHNSLVPDQMVRDIEISENGVIWMATNDGVLKIDGNKFTPLKFWPGRFHNTIMGIALQNDKTVWISTTTGLVKLTD
jgi:ligand-binding sensor domain-containing protein